METKIKRINRLGQIVWYGYSVYTQKVELHKFDTNEKAEVYTYNSVEMPDKLGQKINYLV